MVYKSNSYTPPNVLIRAQSGTSWMRKNFSILCFSLYTTVKMVIWCKFLKFDCALLLKLRKMQCPLTPCWNKLVQRVLQFLAGNFSWVLFYDSTILSYLNTIIIMLLILLLSHNIIIQICYASCINAKAIHNSIWFQHLCTMHSIS